MEDTVEVMLLHKSYNQEHSQEKSLVPAASGAVLTGFYGLWTLFALPGFRKVPMCLKQNTDPECNETPAWENRVSGRSGLRGWASDASGGFLQMTTFSPQYMVFAATVEGFQCTGFEINSILTGYARVKAKWKGIPSSTVHFANQDFWKTNLSKYNNVTVFLAPGVMEVLGRKLEKELPDEARVIACRFPFSDWTPTATEGEGLDQAWAYDMNIIRKLSTHTIRR